VPEPRIVSIDLTHLVEAALRGDHHGQSADRPVPSSVDTALRPADQLRGDRID